MVTDHPYIVEVENSKYGWFTVYAHDAAQARERAEKALFSGERITDIREKTSASTH